MNTFVIISIAFALVGGVSLNYQIYKMTVIDADARELKHPKFWGFFSISANNGSSILLYLIGRKKYPIINMSEEKKAEIERCKKRAGVSIIFLDIASIILIISALLL